MTREIQIDEKITRVTPLRHGETLSFWQDSITVPAYPKLDRNINVDVCIIGAGIGGLTTAYLLMKEGKKVAVIESFEIGSGQTGKTTAHFSTALDDRYFELEKIHGHVGAKMAATSHGAAIKLVEKIIQDESIDCDHQKLEGYLFAKDDPRPDVLQREMEAAHRAGLSVKFLKKAPLKEFDSGPCLVFSDQLQLHPLKYLNGLAQAVTTNGGFIYTHTHVTDVKSGVIPEVKTQDGFTVRCESLVVATNTPINDVFAIHTKQAPYRSYVMAFNIPKKAVPLGLYWDTLDPYHYVRIEKGPVDDLLIIGGEDHKTGQEEHPELCFTRLETWSRHHFPSIKSIAYQWSGQVMEPVDGLGFLGHNPLDRDNIYVITADSGNGMTHCTIGGLLITDQIMGRENPWEKLYDPSRISLRSMPDYFRENANVAAQYGEWFAAKPKPDVHAFQKGEGLVFRDGLRMVAAYKAPNGEIQFMSAACPHLGGVVHWNSVEKSWDCPCHGSRFDCAGKVLEGPAVQDLKPLDDVELETPQPALEKSAVDYVTMRSTLA